MLGRIPELVSALRAARADTSRLVNIQLKVSAFELGLVPFEATMAPADSSGSNAPLLLRTLTSMTREIRRGEPLKLEWNRPPRILFAFASPPNLPAVPAQAHLDALRRAIDPWIRIKDSPGERVDEVRKVLTVLANATARRISEACRSADYTHVHLLAHGAPVPQSEGRRFGVLLGADDGSNGHVVVDGQGLAMALKSMDSAGLARQPPTVVTLATCDSGNTGTVLTPGGSIAHELHAQDIPWVIASQFPLWMRASSLAVETFYRGLLAGNDPRWVLHELRQRLRIELPDTHDWASIVAYAAIAPELAVQVERFRTRQVKARMEVKFDRMDELIGVNEPDPQKRKERDTAAVETELAQLREAIRRDIEAWCGERAAERDPKEKAERLGMAAASEKRIAIVYARLGKADKSSEAYRKSRHFYEAALRAEPTNHWVLSQFLSMAATPVLAATDEAVRALGVQHADSWRVARQLAQWQLRSPLPLARAWAHGTLAELELLGLVYRSDGFAQEAARDCIVRHCAELCELSESNPDPVRSTQRQFRRYLDYWAREGWNGLAQAALEMLEQGSDRGG
jgi:hypothetical protein